MQMQAIVAARPHAETSEGGRASDAGADRDRAELVLVGERGCDPASPGPRDDAGDDGRAQCGLGDAACTQRRDARDVTEPGEFAEDVWHGGILRHRTARARRGHSHRGGPRELPVAGGHVIASAGTSTRTTACRASGTPAERQKFLHRREGR
jgi:hypothetical protein